MKKIIKGYLKKIDFNEVRFIYALAGVVFVAGFGLLVWFGYGHFFSGIDPALEQLTEEQVKETECDYRRGLDGVCVEMKKDISPHLIAIMIENHLEARPQSGLAEAQVVYEAPVEANYTRFLALYPWDEKVDKVGPIRSARPYYLDWLAEYGHPLYMHVGGSPVALDLIDEYGVDDLNEFYHGWYYWRSEDRAAPHNVYTSSVFWQKALTDYYESDYEEDLYEGWKFVTSSFSEHENIETQEQVKEITVSFLPPVYEAVWEYNTSTNQYERYQMGELHLDQNGSKIVADTIVIMWVDKKVLDAVGRLELGTIGLGEATVIYNGQKIEGQWRKDSREARTRFFDSSDEEIKLKPGKIWLEVVPEDGEVSFE